MASKDVERRPDGAFDVLKAATTDLERYEAGQYAIELVPLVHGSGEIPRFFYDLPWANDDADVVSGILAQLASAPDIAKATQAKELRKVNDLVDQPVTVLGLAVRTSDVEDAAWSGYLSLTVSVDGGAPEVINTGAAQVCVTMWRLWCEGRLPASGRFTKLGAPQKGRNQPLGFVVEDRF